MLKKLSYKQKTYALIGVFVFFLFAGYRLSFSDTFTLASEINAKQEKLSWLKAKEKELPALKAKMNEFEKAYSGSDSNSVRDKLTAYISEFAEKNNCIVTEIPLNNSFKNDRLKVQTNSFTLKGSYADLLTLIYNLETEYKYVSKIMSARFFTIKDLQTQRKTLYLTFFAQSFKQKEK